MAHDQGAVDPPERMSDMTKFKEHTIWDSQPDYADWRADMEAEYPDMTEDERYERMLEINADYLDDERANLNVPLSMPILLIAVYIAIGEVIGCYVLGELLATILLPYRFRIFAE